MGKANAVGLTSIDGGFFSFAIFINRVYSNKSLRLKPEILIILVMEGPLQMFC